MDETLDTATRATLVRLVVQLREENTLLQAENTEQRERIARLEQQVTRLQQQITVLQQQQVGGEDSGGTATPPPAPPPRRPRVSRPAGTPRRRRQHGYARRRSAPTRQEVHALSACRRCGGKLWGGSVKRTREVLHIPLVRAEVIEHLFVERRCPHCGLRQTPRAEVLAGEVLGQQRVSRQTVALIATLREEGRLPVGVIQWLLQGLWGLEVSQGEVVEVLHRVARRAQGEVEAIHRQVQASPVLHGDETVWRENGHQGYFWSFSTPHACYQVYRPTRSGDVVEEVLGRHCTGTLVTDFYAAYHRHGGPHQRCWVHLLRDVHELKAAFPDEAEVQAWGNAVYALYQRACQYRATQAEAPWRERAHAARRFEGEAVALCQPFGEGASPQRTLCQRIVRFAAQLFTFVVDVRVPPDNNAAERAVRPLAVCRKISGGTRSSQGSATKGTLASLFNTWRLRGQDPLRALCQLLAPP